MEHHEVHDLPGGEAQERRARESSGAGEPPGAVGAQEADEPDRVAELFRGMLEAEGADVAVTDSLAPLDDPEDLRLLDLIVPVWTMSELSREAATNVFEAVAQSVDPDLVVPLPRPA